MFAVRGAIQVSANTAEAILGAAAKLVREVCLRNRLEKTDLVSIVFSITEDLTAANPATGIRLDGFADTPLFCVQEARVDGGMPRVIRMLLTADPDTGGRRWAVHVYLDGAEALRPDLKA